MIMLERQQHRLWLKDEVLFETCVSCWVDSLHLTAEMSILGCVDLSHKLSGMRACIKVRSHLQSNAVSSHVLHSGTLQGNSQTSTDPKAPNQAWVRSDRTDRTSRK